MPHIPPIKIELNPYNAMAILSFLREYINDDIKDEPEFTAISNAVNEYELQVEKKITLEQINYARFENNVNQIIGTSPTRNKNNS